MTERRRSVPRAAGRAPFVAVALFYFVLFAAVIWPVYPAFATIEPRVLGIPFGMAYVVAALVLSFLALLGFYLWEGSDRGASPDLDGDDD